MAIEKKQVLQTLSDVLSWMATYAGGTVPSDQDPQYTNWVRWIQLGQQDAANRHFWRRLLIPDTITITAGESTLVLPDDFNKINGLYVLNVNGVNWAQPNNEDGQRLWVYMRPSDAKYVVKFLGFTPQQTVNAELWYFYNPPIPTEANDPLYLDGEMAGFYALKEHFRKQGQPGSMDDARIEYENRFEDQTNLEVIPSPQELISWSNYSDYLGQSPNEKQFYRGRRTGR